MKYSKYVLVTFLPIFLTLACKLQRIPEDPVEVAVPTNFTAAAGDSMISLTWTNPDDPDFDKVIIRFTTSGDYPIDKDDGELIYEGSETQVNHTELTNDLEYQYSIFSLDVFMEVSEAAHTSAIPYTDIPDNNSPGVIRALTYNIKVAVTASNIDEWIDIRRHLVMNVITNNQPDIIGFQEAYDRRSGSAGITQKDALIDLFKSTKWQIHCSNDVNNMNCISYNGDNFEHVESGEHIVDIVNYQGQEYYQRFWEYHDFFHEEDQGDGQYFTHTMTQYRYLTWVVMKDNPTQKNVIALASHYETYIPIPEEKLDSKRDLYIERGLDVLWGEDIDMAYGNFQIVSNDIFGYLSRQTVSQVESIKAKYDTGGEISAIVILVDAETGDYTLPAQAEFINAGYVEAFREVQPENEWSRRPTQGIDNIFVKLDALTVTDAYYDQSDYSENGIRPSDHTPYFADFTLSQ